MANNSASDSEEKKPVNIIKMKYGGTTYEVREFFPGTKTLEDIITQRIIQESKMNPSPPTRIQTQNA